MVWCTPDAWSTDDDYYRSCGGYAIDRDGNDDHQGAAVIDEEI